jgi:hypothetical protein
MSLSQPTCALFEAYLSSIDQNDEECIEATDVFADDCGCGTAPSEGDDNEESLLPSSSDVLDPPSSSTTPSADRCNLCWDGSAPANTDYNVEDILRTAGFGATFPADSGVDLTCQVLAALLLQEAHSDAQLYWPVSAAALQSRTFATFVQMI